MPPLKALLLPPALLVLAVAVALKHIDLDADSDFDWAQVPPWPVFSAVVGAANWIPTLESRILPPHIRLVGLGASFIQSRALHTVAQLGIADALASGPLPVAQLAEAKGVKQEHLHRVLRLLAGVGVFREVSPGVYGNNRASGVLRRDHPTSVLDVVGLLGDESYWAFTKLPESLSLDHQITPFQDMAQGHSFWEWIAMEENRNTHGARFDRAMVNIGGWNIPPLLQDYDWSQHANLTVMDVGGGLGHVLRAIMEQQPTIRGILFDRHPSQHHYLEAGFTSMRPEEVERARALWAQEHASLLERAEFVSGDFFVSVPPADVYFLQHILHDWPDEACLRILQTLRRSMGAGASPRPSTRLILSEIVMPADSRPVPFKAVLDLQMLAVPGGKERTVAQWSALLEGSGFALEQVVHVRTLDSVLVARPRVV